MSTARAMLQVAASPHAPPGGKRASRAEVERRSRSIEQMLASGKTRHEMARATGMPLRTVDEYARRVRARWQEDAQAHANDARGRALRRLLALRERLLAANAWGPLVSLERLIADVEGVRGTANAGPPAETSTMSMKVRPMTAEWLRERLPLLVQAVGRLAHQSGDASLIESTRDALGQSLSMLGTSRQDSETGRTAPSQPSSRALR